MAVLHDWNCIAHGHFEAFVGKCPHGCGAGMVQKVFLKAPGVKSDRTKSTDRNMRVLADDFGVTDMNNRNGTAAADDFRWSQPNNDMLSGKPFAVKVDSKSDNAISSFMGEIGATDSGGNVVAAMKQQGQLQEFKANIVGSYNPKVKPEAA